MESGKKYLEIIEKLKGKTAGIFIDDANLFYIQKEAGEGRFNNERIKKALEQINFQVITKPLKKIYLDDKKDEFKNKCNCDVEIAFDIARNIGKIDIVIIMSGDSDFLEAKNFCLENGKQFLIMCFEKRAPWEFRKIHHVFFENIKSFIKT